jgi:hypothetical protein
VKKNKIHHNSEYGILLSRAAATIVENDICENTLAGNYGSSYFLFFNNRTVIKFENTYFCLFFIFLLLFTGVDIMNGVASLIKNNISSNLEGIHVYDGGNYKRINQSIDHFFSLICVI